MRHLTFLYEVIFVEKNEMVSFVRSIILRRLLSYLLYASFLDTKYDGKEKIIMSLHAL